MSELLKGLRLHLDQRQLEKLAAATVGIIGAGGLGSNVAMMLARSGLRRFIIADPDQVEASNLNRQQYWPEHLGQLKVEALRDLLLRLDPALKLTLLPLSISQDNFSRLLPCQIIVEAVDSPESKAAIYENATASGIFLVSASGLAGVSGPSMSKRRLAERAVLVGDFENEQGPGQPAMAPRVTMAAAMQAEAVLEYLLGA